MPTYCPILPYNGAALIEQMGEHIAGEFENGEEFADLLCDRATAKEARLDELLLAAWATFVDEAGLTEEMSDEDMAEVPFPAQAPTVRGEEG